LLEQSDPHDRLTATRGLVARVRQHLAAAETVPVLDEVVQRTGVALRLFVLGNALNPAGCSLDRADAV